MIRTLRTNIAEGESHESLADKAKAIFDTSPEA